MKGDSMDITDAMEVMSEAGRGDEAVEIVQQAVASAHGIYKQILRDETRTSEYKQQEMERIHEGARDALARKLTAIAETCRTAGNTDAGQVFGVDGIKGDPASLAISRRDALDRVSDIDTGSELRRLLRDATQVGDEVLARAVAFKAMELDDVDTLNAFTADRPSMEDPVQRLWDARRRRRNRGQRAFRDSMTLLGMRPPEMSMR